MKCPHCESEFDAVTKELVQLRNEDMWINHCEEMFRNGWRPSKIDKLPDNLKSSTRMIKYYEGLEKRIAKRDRGEQ